jgi:threonine/homoserine/homoserine lactone efflux protein
MVSFLLRMVMISHVRAVTSDPMFAFALAKSYRLPWAGAYLSLGHAMVEVPVILLIYFGFGPFFQNEIVQLVLNIVEGQCAYPAGDSCILCPYRDS